MNTHNIETITMADELPERSLKNETFNADETNTPHAMVTMCPSCGGDMVFNPQTGNLKCPYCDAEKAIEAVNRVIMEQSFASALAKGVRTWDEDDVKSFTCKNCGAQIIFDSHTQAQFCNYCGSSHIALEETEKTISPQYLVPFGVTEKAAGNHFKEWIKKRWFAPNDLKKAYQNDKLLGTYIPHWTYDSDTYSCYTAQRGDYYYVTRTRVVNGKETTYQEQHTRWTSVSGVYSQFFDDILVRASNKVDSKMIQKIQPFNLNALTGYKPEYLSGFYAERYSVALEEGWFSARNDINRQIEGGVTRKIGGDTVRALNIQTQYNAITFKHILLPIWLSSFNYQSKIYHFMINGQTGRVVGEYPKSPIKIALAMLAGLIIGCIIFWLYGGNG